MAEFTQKDIEKFLVDESFSLFKKIKQLYEPYQKDDKGKYLDFEEGLDLVHREAKNMIEQIMNGSLLSSEPDWKQATVLLWLSELLYDHTILNWSKNQNYHSLPFVLKNLYNVSM